MALFKNTYWKLSEKFITKEQWNNHIYSSRHLHSEVNGNFPQITLTWD